MGELMTRGGGWGRAERGAGRYFGRLHISQLDVAADVLRKVQWAQVHSAAALAPPPMGGRGDACAPTKLSDRCAANGAVNRHDGYDSRHVI